MKQATLRDMFLKPSKHVCTSAIVVSPDPLSPTVSSSLAMKSPENTVSWQQPIYCNITKYMGFFQDAVYQDPAYFYNCSTKNINKNPTRCNSTQIFIYCKVTLHVSGVLKTVTAASGTGHNTGTATSLQSGLMFYKEISTF